MSAHVTVSIVTWNSGRDIRACLESLQTQTFRDFSLTIVDNASIDDTVSLVREVYPKAAVIRKRLNVGFGVGHNQTILLSRSPFVLCLNPDTLLTPDALARLVAAIEAGGAIGAVGPKLLRFSLGGDEINPIQTTRLIDSVGITQLRNGSFLERGANEMDNGQYETPAECFAVSGACILLRRSALEDVRMVDEFFDADFFAYKEDVDLCWRLHHRGWRVRTAPAAVVYHRRAVQGPVNVRSPRQQRTFREQRSPRIRWLSYRNHFLTHLKNQSAGEILRRLPWTAPQELGKFLYLLCREPATLRAIPQIVKLVPTLLKKRRLILRQRHASRHETFHRHP